MGKLKFRIGTKLGLSAGIGILLVAGMLVNDHLSKAANGRAEAQANAQKTLMVDAVAVKSAVQGTQLAMHQARYGRTAREIEKAVSTLNTVGAAGRAHIESALNLTADQEGRDRFTRIQTRFGDSLKAAAEIAAKQREILRLETQRQEVTDRWAKIVEELLSTVAALGPGGKDIETKIRAADSTFKEARIAALQFQVSGDEVLMALILRAGDDATVIIRAAEEMVTDPALRARVSGLATTIDSFRKTLEELIDHEEGKLRMVRLRTNLIADEIVGLIDKAVADATEQTQKSDVAVATSMRDAERISLAVGGAVIAILIGSALLSLFNIARPIRRIGDVLRALAEGNKEVAIPYVARGDEVGDTARAARTFQEQLIRMETLEGEQKEIERRGAEDRRADMARLADQFETAVGNVLQAVTGAAGDLESAAGTLTGTAESTQELSGKVARISEDASSNVQSVAAASDELSASVNEIARQVEESTRIAQAAVEQAAQTDSRIGQLLLAAQRIGDVVKLITAIAEQTNLLALNATIEAARAGDAGRGFAVVAQEVKALAAQTAKATDEIGGQISAIQGATRDSVAAIKEIAQTIGRVSEIATAVSAAVEEQGAATREISRNAQEAANGTAQVAGNIADVNRAATETGSASTQVLSAAQALSREGELLRQEVGRFLETVRTAA